MRITNLPYWIYSDLPKWTALYALSISCMNFQNFHHKFYFRQTHLFEHSAELHSLWQWQWTTCDLSAVGIFTLDFMYKGSRLNFYYNLAINVFILQNQITTIFICRINELFYFLFIQNINKNILFKLIYSSFFFLN